MSLTQELRETLTRILAELPYPVRLVARDGSVLVRNAASEQLGPDGLGHLDQSAQHASHSCPACQLAAQFEQPEPRLWHVIHPRAPDAERRYWEVVLCPVRDATGNVWAVLELLRDATVALSLEHYLIEETERSEGLVEHRAAEARQLGAELGQLRATQTTFLYRDRMMALGQLVASLAHEIHTPLGAMLSSADLLTRSLARLEHEVGAAVGDAGREAVDRRLAAVRQSAGIMAEGARRIQAVIRTLQVFSRLDEAPLKRADLHAGLDSTIDLVRFRLGDRVRLRREYATLPELTCRPDALNQVFMNLLQNAIQAIPESGEIVVRTRREGDELQVEIADTGGGIGPEDLERIFQLGFTTRDGGSGSGIGLALSLKIVEEHGGRIDVTSHPGTGSTFTVRLPLAPLDREAG